MAKDRREYQRQYYLTHQTERKRKAMEWYKAHREEYNAKRYAKRAEEGC